MNSRQKISNPNKKDYKEISVNEAKAKAEKAAKAKAAKDAKEKAKQDAADASKLEDELLSEDIGGAAAGPSGNSSIPSATAGPGGSGGDSNAYAGLLTNMIGQRMLVDRNMKGKEAVVKIRLAPDGLLLSVSCVSGEPAICRAGIAAVNMIGSFPKPPTENDRTINATLRPAL